MTKAPQLPRTPKASGADRVAVATRTSRQGGGHLSLVAPWVAVLALPVGAAAGCGGSEKPMAASTASNPSQRVESIAHERCDTSGGQVEALDTNGDGKPDIRRVYDGSKHEVCRVVDLNHDGKTDLYEYFDAAGAIRRREFCYDDTGDVNAVEIYQGGKLVEREYDTTGQHRIDTWDWFDANAAIDVKTGRPKHPTRRERDVRGGGMVDQWWTWNGDVLSIATDKNGDGRPDPASVVYLGGEDGGPAPSGSSAGPSAPPPAGDAGPQANSEGAKP